MFSPSSAAAEEAVSSWIRSARDCDRRGDAYVNERRARVGPDNLRASTLMKSKLPIRVTTLPPWNLRRLNEIAGHSGV